MSHSGPENFSTKFVEQYFKPEYLKGESTTEEEMIAAVLATTWLPLLQQQLSRYNNQYR